MKLRNLLLPAFFLAVSFITYLLFYQKGDGFLRRFSAECIGCHVSNAIHLNGPMASGLSKGSHVVNVGFSGKNQLDTNLVLTGKECKKCHAEIHDSWAGSNHGKAFTNVIFRAGLERENHAWCINCHGPLWDAKKVSLKAATEKVQASGELHEAGVSCVVCHMNNGKIYTRNAESLKSKTLYHPVYEDSKLGSGDFCAGCHQFNFPSETEPLVAYELRNPMQNTVQEYKNVTEQRVACYSCHIDKKNHSLHPKGDLKQMLKYAIQSKNTQDGQIVTFSIRLENLGHHFPTGDLFRILSLLVYDKNQKILFKKDYRKEVRVVDREIISDSTLKPDKQTLVAADKVDTFLRTRAHRCEIVYRRQGAIENEPGKLPMSPKIHRQVIYDGPCQTAGH